MKNFVDDKRKYMLQLKFCCRSHLLCFQPYLMCLTLKLTQWWLLFEWIGMIQYAMPPLYYHVGSNWLWHNGHSRFKYLKKKKMLTIFFSLPKCVWPTNCFDSEKICLNSWTTMLLYLKACWKMLNNFEFAHNDRIFSARKKPLNSLSIKWDTKLKGCF